MRLRLYGRDAAQPCPDWGEEVGADTVQENYWPLHNSFGEPRLGYCYGLNYIPSKRYVEVPPQNVTFTGSS